MPLQTHLIYFPQLYKDYNYVWFSKNLKENIEESTRNSEGKKIQ